MHKMHMGGSWILNQNYNASQKVFQNAPNGIRACLDFENFPRVLDAQVSLKSTPVNLNVAQVSLKGLT